MAYLFRAVNSNRIDLSGLMVWTTKFTVAARFRARTSDPSAAEASLMLSDAEAARAIVTQLGPSARSWALAAEAADLERRALAAHPTLRPGWAAS